MTSDGLNAIHRRADRRNFGKLYFGVNLSKVGFGSRCCMWNGLHPIPKIPMAVGDRLSH